MANDYLLPIAQLIEQFGSSTIWKSTEPLGLTAFNKSNHGAEVLFGEDTFTILEVARIYSVFANLGVQNGRITPKGSSVEPASVLRIAAADGRVIFAPAAPDSQSVLSAPIAYLVHSILADELARRAEYGHPNLLEIGKPAGAKVGTIASHQEAWTVGYTNTFLVASWIGTKPPDTTNEIVDYQTAAGVWNALIQFASQDEAGSEWEIPVGISQVDVCDPSGKLATAICPVVVTEYFLNGSEPSEYDTLYQQIQVNRETDRLATVFTPLELVQEQTFLVVPLEAKPWAIAQGIPQPPTEYDTIQAPPENPQVRIANPVMFDYVHGEVEVTGTAADNYFQSYSLQVGEGLNPSSWQEIGSGTSPIKEGKLGTWQTGQDGLYAMRLVVVGENQKLTTAIIQVSVDNTPPLARILYPVDGASIAITDQQTIFFQVDIEENVKVDKIRWMIDEVQIAETGAENFSLSWKPEAGEHTLSISVIDIAGNSTTTIPVSFTVNR